MARLVLDDEHQSLGRCGCVHPGSIGAAGSRKVNATFELCTSRRSQGLSAVLGPSRPAVVPSRSAAQYRDEFGYPRRHPRACGSVVVAEWRRGCTYGRPLSSHRSASRRTVVDTAPPPFRSGRRACCSPVRLSGSTDPLTLLDTISGQTQTVRKFPGLLRAGVVDDTGAWLLGTYGLARVSLPKLTLVRTLRAGVPDQGAFLYDLGSGVLAVSRFKGATLTLIHTDDGDRVRRLRLPPAEQLVPSAEGRWLYSAEEGEALLLDRDTLKVRRRGVLPSGRFSIATDSVVFVSRRAADAGVRGTDKDALPGEPRARYAGQPGHF